MKGTHFCKIKAVKSNKGGTVTNITRLQYAVTADEMFAPHLYGFQFSYFHIRTFSFYKATPIVYSGSGSSN